MTIESQTTKSLKKTPLSTPQDRATVLASLRAAAHQSSEPGIGYVAADSMGELRTLLGLEDIGMRRFKNSLYFLKASRTSRGYERLIILIHPSKEQSIKHVTIKVLL